MAFIYKYIAIAGVILLLLAGLAVQTSRVHTRDATIKQLTQEISQCKLDNDSDLKVIAKLGLDVANANKTCDTRLRIKNAEINKINQIRETKGVTNEKIDNNTGDDLVNELDSLWSFDAVPNEIPIHPVSGSDVAR